MSQSEDKSAPTTSLTNHDHTPIHIPGSIQPHGVLLALNYQLEIQQVSNNTQEFLGKDIDDLLGQSLSHLLNAQQVETVQQCLAKEVGQISGFPVKINTSNHEQNFYSIVHRTADAVILELEPTDASSELSFLDFQALAGEAIAKMQQTSDLREFLHLMAEQISNITGFDRVMIYKFDQQDSGTVIAEVKREDLSPYLGLYFPSTDIPTPARELYQRCWLRYIPNVNVSPVQLLPQEHPHVDLTYSVLRSFNDCCAEYHQNMGVSSLLVISLMQNQQLWGLISCHHQTPKYLTYEVRKMCELLGQIVSSELAHKISHSEWDYEVKLKSLQSELLASISQADNFIDALIKPEIRLLDLVSATGAAVCLDNEITLVGTTPNIQQVRTLIEWADTQVNDNLFASNSLPKLYPEATAFKDTASGLLLLRISKVRHYYILWFRPEVMQTVNWAGNPNDSIKVEADGSITLCPRKSFAAWQETVRLTSLPWQSCELDSAIALRNAIVGIVLSKADELAKINLELERSNQELAAFAYAASHDLKEPLRGIYNFSTILLEDYHQILDDEGVECLETVVNLSVRMETLINALLRISQLGQVQLHREATDLNELIDRVIEVFRASRQEIEFVDICIPRTLPIIECDRVLVNEIFSNLIGNAFKYNEKPDPWIEIGYLDPDNHPLVFYIRDNGIGIPEHHQETIFRLFKRLHSQEKYGGGAGAGLAIVKKIVELHEGQIWVESSIGVGSTFYFTLE